MRSPIKPLVISFITQYSELVIQFIGVMILARIMTPKEIGVYSVAAFLMTLLHVFRDFGVGRFVVQTQELTVEKIRSSLGVAIILASTVALILFASSSLIADIYGVPEIKQILVVMSASFAITPIGSVLTAIFRREMQFKKILVVRVTSALCHVTVAITLAKNGYGALSLAWANFAGILAFGIIANALRSPSTPWIPQFKNIKEILSFGSIASVGSVAGVAANNSPDVIIAKVLNLAAGGYFSRANGLIQLFKTLVTGSVMPIILPYFAQIKRDKGDLIGPYHLAVTHLTVFAWPFFGTMAILALPVVRTLYGPQWDTSVPIVQVLCIAGAISSIGTFAGEVMIANGYIRNVTVIQVITSIIRIIGILIASAYGLLGISISIVLSECFSLAITSHVLRKTLGVSFISVLKATGKNAVIVCASLAGPISAALFLNGSATNTLLLLVVGLTGALLGWTISIVCTGHPMRQHIYQIVRRVTRNTPKPATGD